jgi:hypothetical protein
MDDFKVLFCLFGGGKFQPRLFWTNAIRSFARSFSHHPHLKSSTDTTNRNKVTSRFSPLQTKYSTTAQLKGLALLSIAMVIPVYLAGCGGGSSVSSQLTPPASTSTGTGTTGTGGTGSTGTTGTGGNGTTGTGGTSGPSPLTATVISSTNVNTSLTYGSNAGDWKPVCVEPGCAPGGSGVPMATSQTINNTEPSKDGKSMHFSLSSNSSSASTNALWVNVAGNCDNCARINTDFWIYITSTAGYVNTHEFDSFIFDKMHGYKNMWGMQCVNGGNWEIDSDFGWSSAGIACNLTVGWHHIQVFNHRIINEVGGPKGYGYNYYDALIVDGVYNDLTGKTTPAEAYPSTYTQSTSGFQFQLDANKNAEPVTIDEYLDLANFYGGN